MLNKPLRRDRRYQVLINITEPTAVEAARRSSEAEQECIRKRIVYLPVCRSSAMMCFISYDDSRLLDPIDMPAHSLNHIDAAEVHINALSDKRVRYLLTELPPMHQELHTILLCSSPS